MTKEMSAKRIYEAPMMIELGELARGFGQGDQCSPGSNASSPGANACTDGAVADCGQPGPPKCCQTGTAPVSPPLGSSSGGGSGFDTGSGSGDDSGSGEGSGFSVP